MTAAGRWIRRAVVCVVVAAMLGGGSAGLELRRLQTLAEIGAEHNSTIVAVIPSEFLRAAQALSTQPGKQ